MDCRCYIKIIDEYLDSLPAKEREERANTWGYKDLKKVAKWWAINNRPSLLPEAIVEQMKIPTSDQAMSALLRGYKKYADENWKNSSDS